MQPKKKPQDRELTAEESEENQIISALRMPIENVFAGLKPMNCLYNVYRNRKAFLAHRYGQCAAGTNKG